MTFFPLLFTSSGNFLHVPYICTFGSFVHSNTKQMRTERRNPGITFTLTVSVCDKYNVLYNNGVCLTRT